MNHFIIKTNLYAEQQLQSTDLKPKSGMQEWFSTNSKEIRQFFGLTFLVGIIKKPNIAMYWSKEIHCTEHPFFCNYYVLQ